MDVTLAATSMAKVIAAAAFPGAATAVRPKMYIGVLLGFAVVVRPSVGDDEPAVCDADHTSEEKVGDGGPD